MAFNVLVDLSPVESQCPPPSPRVGEGMGKLRHGDSGVGRGKKLEYGELRDEAGSERLYCPACYKA